MLLATPALEAPVFLSATSPESTMPKQLVLTEADLASRWAMCMKCWVCSRQAKGFGHVDLRFKVGHPKRYPIDWIFCSQRCQACFHRLYAAGVRALEREGTLPTGVGVIDPSEAELAAMQQCLKPLGEAAGEIGMDRPLSSYSQKEALRLINAVVTTYVEAMVQEHERSKYPPVRMQLDASALG